MGNQNGIDRTVGEQRLGLFLRKVVTPRAKGGDRNAASNSKKGLAVDDGSTAVQDGNVWPIAASCLQLLKRFAISRDENGGLGNETESIDRDLNAVSHVGKVSGADDKIDVVGSSDQTIGCLAITMKVAKAKDTFHDEISQVVSWKAPLAGQPMGSHRASCVGVAKRSRANDRQKKGPTNRRRPFDEEASVGFEPTMADLQSAALATWPRRRFVLQAPLIHANYRIKFARSRGMDKAGKI